MNIRNVSTALGGGVVTASGSLAPATRVALKLCGHRTIGAQGATAGLLTIKFNL